MLKARSFPFELIFKEAAVTSRDVMSSKLTYIVEIWDDRTPDIQGTGEIALFKGLSREDIPDYPDIIAKYLESIERHVTVCSNNGKQTFEFNGTHYSSLNFGIETALANLENALSKEHNSSIIFDSDFTRNANGLQINGLIWMGSFPEMKDRINSKLEEGFKVIKLKIGGINFKDEVKLLEYIRKKDDKITIRLDANGSFSRCSYEKAKVMLKELRYFDIHSIEQPFKVEDIENTKRICAEHIVPIALDEQLIGVNDNHQKRTILDMFNPQYIVLKPSLCGGFKHTKEWIMLAEEKDTGWWTTSALESSIGLNAIAQFTASVPGKIPVSGLGTGELFLNDFPSPLVRKGDCLFYSGDR